MFTTTVKWSQRAGWNGQSDKHGSGGAPGEFGQDLAEENNLGDMSVFISE